MRELRPLIRFIEKDYLFKLIFVLALFALVPFAEIFLFVFLGHLLGNWLVIVLAVTAALPGVLIGQGQLREILPRLRENLREGRYPGADFANLVGLLVVGVLLVTPGFITDVLGYLLFIPALRGIVAKALARGLNRNLGDLSSYLGLREL